MVQIVRGRTRWGAPIIALALAATLGGCGTDNAITVAPGSTADSLVFELSAGEGTATAPTLVYGLTVVTCGSEKVMWLIAEETGEGTIPARVVYGRPVKGFLTRTGPLPLTPGCYEAIISGPASVRFEVRRDGTVLARAGTR